MAIPMPFPPFLIAASAILCEKVLYEADGVISAIRIVDIFSVPKNPAGTPEDALPEIQFYALVALRAEPAHDQPHELVIKLLNTVGELNALGPPTPVETMMSPLGPTVPGGVTLSIQVNIAVKRFGICFLCVYLDGEEITRTPFTLLRVPGESDMHD
jgi:hypothetical protein